MATRDEHRYRAGLAQFSAEQFGDYHITLQLAPHRSRAELEHTIREFYNRVNRRFVGTKWRTPKLRDRLMTGIVFFEEGCGGWHAHLMIRAPSGVDPLSFERTIPHIWVAQPDTAAVYPHPVTGRTGKIHIQRVRATPSDRRRVGQYDTKDYRFARDDGSLWKFIDQLAALRRRR